MIIPLKELEPQTLFNIIESFVLREGTNYGQQEFTIDQKVEQVKAQLDSGEAVLVYSELHESVDIVPASSLNIE